MRRIIAGALVFLGVAILGAHRHFRPSIGESPTLFI